MMRRFGTERRLLNLTPSQLKLNSFATRISRQRCSSVMVSPILRPLSLLLSRNSAALTSSCNRTITQAVWTRPTLRDYGLKRLSHGSSVVLQELQSGDSEAAGTSQGLALTDSCVEQLLKVSQEEPGLMLRVTVDGGGCSGFQYKVNLDTKVNSDDRVFEREGARVVVDELSLELVDGCTVDYHTELIRAAFRIVGNPKAESSCSCGTSFALK